MFLKPPSRHASLTCEIGMARDAANLPVIGQPTQGRLCRCSTLNLGQRKHTRWMSIAEEPMLSPATNPKGRGLSVAELAKSFGRPGDSPKVLTTFATNYP